MKKMIFTLFVFFAFISCDETVNPTMVWGTVWARGINGTVALQGATLGESLADADMIGSCSYENNKFSFVVGRDLPKSIDWDKEYFFEIKGIQGPPSKKPYLADGTLREDDQSTFTEGRIYTVSGAWIFQEKNIVADKCKVVLFAEAETGDLTPKEYGKSPFDYVVKIDCTAGLENVESQLSGATKNDILTGFNVMLWFKNCES